MVTRSPHRRLLIAAALVLGLFAFAPGTASAQVLDPATLHINGGTAYLFNNKEVHGIGSGLVSVSQTSGGADALNNPWYLILGIAGQTNGTGLPTIKTVTTTGGGSTSFSAGTFETTFTAASSGDAYSTLGAPFNLADTNSELFGNWHDADLAINGLNVSSFGLVAYQISANLADKDVASIQFDSLPLGTFVIAFGLTGTTTNGTVYDTPFTESGVSTDNNHITSTPEPSTMALALSGLVGAGFAGLRRLRRPRAVTV